MAWHADVRSYYHSVRKAIANDPHSLVCSGKFFDGVWLLVWLTVIEDPTLTQLYYMRIILRFLEAIFQRHKGDTVFIFKKNKNSFASLFFSYLYSFRRIRTKSHESKNKDRWKSFICDRLGWCAGKTIFQELSNWNSNQVTRYLFFFSRDCKYF